MHHSAVFHKEQKAGGKSLLSAIHEPSQTTPKVMEVYGGIPGHQYCFADYELAKMHDVL